MASRTTNYNLVKPARDEKIKVSDLNTNSDIIDRTLKQLQTGLESVSVPDIEVSQQVTQSGTAPVSGGAVYNYVNDKINSYQYSAPLATTRTKGEMIVGTNLSVQSGIVSVDVVSSVVSGSGKPVTSGAVYSAIQDINTSGVVVDQQITEDSTNAASSAAVFSFVENELALFEYDAPVASMQTKGEIKVGNNLIVASDGTLSVDTDDSVSSESSKPVTSAAVASAISNIPSDSYDDSELRKLINEKQPSGNYVTQESLSGLTFANPNKLILTGAVSAEYDGSSAVTVTIPSGTGGGDPSPSTVTIVDGLTSDSTTSALSANQGRVLNLAVESKMKRYIIKLISSGSNSYSLVDLENQPVLFNALLSKIKDTSNYVVCTYGNSKLRPQYVSENEILFIGLDRASTTSKVLRMHVLPNSVTYESFNLAESNNVQAPLVSGTNIKTINNQTILGSGNIDIVPQTISQLAVLHANFRVNPDTLSYTVPGVTSDMVVVRSAIDLGVQGSEWIITTSENTISIDGMINQIGDVELLLIQDGATLLDEQALKINHLDTQLQEIHNLKYTS